MNDRNSIAPIKSMELFLIDNQQVWGKGAKLVGDFIVWPDDGIYPSYAPVGILTHPNYDGRIVVQAGNRGIVVSFCAGAKDGKDCQRILSAKDRPEQYRIAIDALVLAGAGTASDLKEVGGHEHQQGVNVLALVAWLAKSAPPEAAVMAEALRRYCAKPDSPEACDLADQMLVTINETQRLAAQAGT